MRLLTPAKIWVILIGILLTGGLFGGLLYYFGTNSLRTEDFRFYPSQPNNWMLVDDSFQLTGRIYYPTGYLSTNQYPTVILFHGLTGKLDDCDAIAKKLAGSGILAVSISFRGHGESGGTFPFDNGLLFNATFGDALGIYRYLTSRADVDLSRIGAHGQSLGGGAAIYLALQGLVPKFVAWYPGTAYIWGDTPLYQYQGNHSQFSGLIIQGTADECTRCAPSFTQYFVDHNPSVELRWIEGGTHGTGLHWSNYLEWTATWFGNVWALSKSSWFIDWYVQGLWGIVIWSLFGVLDSILLFVFMNRRRKNKQTKE
jgi:dienelactone hydrolase